MQRDDQPFEFRRLASLGWQAEDFPRTPEGVRLTDESVSVNYPDAGLTALGFEGEASYWFDHRAEAVIDALAGTTEAKSIWDVGAGTGAMSLRLANAGFEVVAVEPLLEGGRAIKTLGCCSVFSGSLAGLKLPSRSIRLIGLFDVIEHLDDPAGLMTEVRRVLEPSGVVVITVPAFQILWSNADVAAGHRRRYTTHRLDRLMNELGFTRVLSRVSLCVSSTGGGGASGTSIPLWTEIQHRSRGCGGIEGSPAESGCRPCYSSASTPRDRTVQALSGFQAALLC